MENDAEEILRLTGCENEGKLICIGLDIPNLRLCLYFMTLFSHNVRYYRLLDNGDGTFQITNQDITWEAWMENLMV